MTSAGQVFLVNDKLVTQIRDSILTRPWDLRGHQDPLPQPLSCASCARDGHVTVKLPSGT